MTKKASAQQISFITGKGGVGKSMISYAYALKKAKAGERVLLIEIGETSFFDRMLGSKNNKITNEFSNLSTTIYSGESCLREYILHYVKIEKVTDLFFDNKVMRALIKAAPALKELALMGKFTSGVRNIGYPMEYDRVVIDGYATGHFLALMRAPKGMYEAIKFGPMGEQCLSIQKVLSNPEHCEYKIVTLPEELPVTEALELDQTLQQEFQVEADIICNKVLPSDFIQSLAQASENNKFIESYKLSAQEQQKSIHFLKQKKQTQLVPYVFETDPVVLLKTLSEYVL